MLPRLAEMSNRTNPFAFPELPDEAVAAVNEWLESLYTDFQNHYYAQLHRWYHDINQRRRDGAAPPAPLDDPPV